jgi:acetate kinase
MKKQSLLVLNCGSTSIKFAQYELLGVASCEPLPLVRGSLDLSVTPPTLRASNFERAASVKLLNEIQTASSEPTQFATVAIKLLEALQRLHSQYELRAVAHRVVHGGAERNTAEILTPVLLADLAHFTPFAPLHQPANLAPIAAIQAEYPTLVQIACFDTAFHRAQPAVMQMTALPRRYFERGLRRMGFHGLSYTFIAGRLAELLGYVPRRLVAAHLGGGASVCAMLDGTSLSCSMGITALDGLPMATRSGSVDPGLLLHLLDSEPMSIMEMRTMLYEQSGLLGVSGISGDMRQLVGNPQVAAQEAVDLFVHRTAREIAATASDLGGIDALVFTGGIGEYQSHIRKKICDKLAWLGVSVSQKFNDDALSENGHMDHRIGDAESRVDVWVVHTDEEVVMAKAALWLIERPG